MRDNMKLILLVFTALIVSGPFAMGKSASPMAARLFAGEVKPSCGANGSRCEWDHECCNGNCNGDHFCGESFCKGNGQACNWDHNCCSGHCNDGACSKDAERQCRSDGATCDWDHECCNGNCNGDHFCGESFCKGDGQSCDWDHNCCSKYCNSSTKTCD